MTRPNGALKLITQDKALAFIGPLTSKVSIPVGEIAEKYKVPMVTGAATNPKVTVYDGKRKEYVFRACFIDPFQGSVAANFVLNNLKAKTAAVLYDVGNDYPPIMTREIFSLIKSVNEKGISIILVEQNAHMALAYSQQTYVLETGRIIMEGESAIVKCDPAIMAAYFGT